MKYNRKRMASFMSVVTISSVLAGAIPTETFASPIEESTNADLDKQTVLNFEDRGTEESALVESYQGCDFGNTGWNTGDIGGSVGLWAENFTKKQQVNKIAIPYGKIFRGFTAKSSAGATVEVLSGTSKNTFEIKDTAKECTTDFTTAEMGVYLIITCEQGADDVKFDDLILEDAEVTKRNLSQGKPVTTSDPCEHPGANGNDGDLGTMWVNNGGGADKWWQVDLEDSYSLNEFELTFEKEETPNAWKFKIEGSNDNENFDVICDRTQNTDGSKTQTGTLLSDTKYRYVRVTITGLPKESYWAGFAEFAVYEDNSLSNVALHKSAKQSDGGNDASLAVDGDTKTFSGNTGNFPYTWEVDLKDTYHIEDVELEWEDLWDKDTNTNIAEDWKYRIESSSDNGETWNTVVDYSETNPYTDPKTSVVQRTKADVDCSKLKVTIVGKPNNRPLAWAIIPEFRAFAKETKAPTEPGQWIETNLAYAKPVVASQTAEGFAGENVTDNDANTTWKPTDVTKDCWIQVDLGKVYDITKSVLTFAEGTAEPTYKTYISEDKENWTEAENIGTAAVKSRYMRYEFVDPSADLEVKQVTVEGTEAASTEKRNIMVLAPHEDDEMLMAGGIIHSAIQRGDNVKVVFATNGDANGESKGLERIREAVNSLGHIGLSKDDIIFMGYADTAGLGGQWGQQYTDSFLYKLFISPDDEVLESLWQNTSTYGVPGFKDDYHFERTQEHAQYTRSSFMEDLTAAISDFMPDDVYVPSRYDMHFDHAYFDLFAIEALQKVKELKPDFSPVLHESIIHSCAQDHNWPVWNEDDKGVLPFEMPAGLETMTTFDWNQRESVTVPYSMRQAPFAYNLKDQALQLYVSQYYGYIGAFAKYDEIFWTRDFTSIAHGSTITASSEVTSTDRKADQSAIKVADGIRDGYATGLPAGHIRFPHAEWVTEKEKEGAWINFSFENPEKVNRVVLYDRPNTADQVLSGRLQFSDGSIVEVGELPNDGRPLEVKFPDKETTSVKFIVDSVSESTASVGLAELEIYYNASETVIPDPDVNKTELNTLYEANTGKDASKYTEESWKKFDTALKAAKTVLDKTDATQEEVDAAKTALNEAIAGLTEKQEEPQANKSELKKLYEANTEKDASKYTEESWKKFDTALKAAKTVLDKTDATQEEVDAVKTALNEAITGLTEKPEEPKVNKSELKELYEANTEKDASKYTEESWKKFDTALKAAKIVLDKTDATQEEVDAAKAALNEAIAGLTEKPEEPKADKSNLSKLYENNKGKDSEKYTAESWKKFDAALKAAKAVLDKADVTQEEIDASHKELEKAIASLEVKKDEPNKDEKPDQKEPEGTWKQNDQGWWLENEDGSYVTDEWREIDGEWYYFGSTGYMQTGWLQTGDTWYYLKDNGAMSTNWELVGDTWYYLNDSGAMETGWVEDGDTWYYLNGSGAMETQWTLVNDTWYYLNDSGAMETGWIEDGEAWYYLNNSGAMETNWKNINGTWYYFDNSGRMQTGWLDLNGTWYYLLDNGAMATGWLLSGNNWYYLNGDGSMATGWLFLGNTWYYLNDSGTMLANTSRRINGVRYRFDANGACLNP